MAHLACLVLRGAQLMRAFRFAKPAYVPDEVFRDYTQHSWKAVAQTFDRVLLGVPAGPLVREVRDVPILNLMGRNDDEIARRAIQQGNVHNVLLPGGHLMLLEHPDSTATAIEQFLIPDTPIPGGHSDRTDVRRKEADGFHVGDVARLALLGVALLAGTGQKPAAGQTDGRAPRIIDPRGPVDHEHRSWTAILARYVTDGTVDYRGLADHGQPALDAYLGVLSAASPAESGWTREERLAFWTNAYNAFTIRLILDNYPLPSIRSIGFLPLAAFRKTFIPLGAGGRSISLNAIENDILRKQFQDARIHFAIVCASKSCPALRSEAYRTSVLDQQLDEAARAFLGDPLKNRWDPASRTLYLSSIFKWFRDDFERAGGPLPAFVGRYVPQPVAADLEKRKVRIVFLNYDWSLNGR